jgi:hypothetical protein
MNEKKDREQRPDGRADRFGPSFPIYRKRIPVDIDSGDQGGYRIERSHQDGGRQYNDQSKTDQDADPQDQQETSVPRSTQCSDLQNLRP